MQVGVTGSTLVATEGARVLADGMKRSQMHFRCTLSVQLYSDMQNLESARSERRLRAFLLTYEPSHTFAQKLLAWASRTGRRCRTAVR